MAAASGGTTTVDLATRVDSGTDASTTTMIRIADDVEIDADLCIAEVDHDDVVATVDDHRPGVGSSSDPHPVETRVTEVGMLATDANQVGIPVL